MIDFMIDGRLTAVVSVGPPMSKSLFAAGKEEKTLVVTAWQSGSDDLTLNISPNTLQKAIWAATKAGDPWLNVDPNDLLKYKQQYETPVAAPVGRPSAGFFNH